MTLRLLSRLTLPHSCFRHPLTTHTCGLALQSKSPQSPVSRDSSLEELETLPEEEAAAAGGDEDREKELLMERIQSLKEEKQVSLAAPDTFPHQPACRKWAVRPWRSLAQGSKSPPLSSRVLLP